MITSFVLIVFITGMWYVGYWTYVNEGHAPGDQTGFLRMRPPPDAVDHEVEQPTRPADDDPRQRLPQGGASGKPRRRRGL